MCGIEAGKWRIAVRPNMIIKKSYLTLCNCNIYECVWKTVRRSTANTEWLQEHRGCYRNIQSVQGATGTYRVLQEHTECTECYRNIQGATECYRNIQGATGCKTLNSHFFLFFLSRSDLHTGRIFMALPFHAPFAHFTEILTIMRVGRDNSVEMMTRYGLDSPGIKFWYERDFPPPSKQALRPAQAPVGTMGTGSFPEVKRPGRGADHPPHL